MMLITLLFTYNSKLLVGTRTKYECIWMPLAVYQDVQWSSVTCIKTDEWWLSHKYYVSYVIMQINMRMMMCVIITERWKLHGNISQNGYGNAMIGRYGGYFEDGIWWVYDTGEKCMVLERLAMVEGRKVRIIHGLNISHKELTYLLQKSISYRNKVLRACS